MREMFKWLGLNTQVQELVGQCMGCQFSGKLTPPTDILRISIPKPVQTWVKMGLDILGPFVDAPANQEYIVIVVDYASNYPEYLLTSDIHSGHIVKWLEMVFAQFGNPDELVSDNGCNSSPVSSLNSSGSMGSPTPVRRSIIQLRTDLWSCSIVY